MKLLEPAQGKIGAEITQFDVKETTAADAAKFRDLVYKHKLVVFRGQSIAEEEYLAFTKKIGTPQIYFQENYHHPKFPEIFVSSNILDDGKKIGVSGTGRYWHTDCSFQDEPLSLTSLSPRVLPNSVRQTFYIDMEQVYRNLPEHLKKIVDAHKAVHEAKWRYKVREQDIDKALTDILAEFEKTAPPATHPAVITHPVTKQPILYINEGFTTVFEGLGIEKSRVILKELFAFIDRPEHVHTHLYQEGDLLLWDNRPLIHKASPVPKGEKNMNYRIGIYDGKPFYDEMNQGELQHETAAAA